ncbi:glycosyl hydrolase 53 [Hortaea werneckii]|nr:glycosyl hydrolase 53 [Hortaea werneckii]KAI7722123.1 glycosyl hydrolase 53 [Hortaea werneckii]
MALPRIGVGVFVFASRTSNRYLLGKRLGSHGAGTYALPGGHLEYGESFEQCATREVQEETGLDITDVRFLTATNSVFHETTKHYVTIFMTAIARSAENGLEPEPKVMEPDKCEAWSWSTFSDMRKMTAATGAELFKPLYSLMEQRGYYESYGLNYTLPLAKRFHDKGYRIYLDYHFSDYWADPSKQWTPEEWPTGMEPLAGTLREYVSSSMKSFSDAGVDLSIVSLGNEIRNGMLWPQGRVDVDIEPASARIANFTDLATLYTAARQGVNDAVSHGVKKPEVMIHIDNGWNLTLQENWFSALTGTGKVKTSDWDIFGFSMYPFYGTSATLKNLKTSLHTLAKKYSKPIHVVETDWPAICDGSDAPELSEPSIPASVPGQIEWVRDVVDVVKSVPHGLGRGVNYWEPTWLNNTGLGSNFDADWSEYPKVTAYSRDSVNMFKGV